MEKRKVVFPDVHVGYTDADLAGVLGTHGYAARGTIVSAEVCYVHDSIIGKQADAVCKLHHMLRRNNLGAEKLVFGGYSTKIEPTLNRYGINGSMAIKPFFIGDNSSNCFPANWFDGKIPSIEASTLANSKIQMRRGMDKSLPFNRIVGFGDDFLGETRRVMKKSPTGEVIIKEDGKASGDGMDVFSDIESAAFYAQQTVERLRVSRSKSREVIIEAKHNKRYDGSIQVFIPRNLGLPVELLGVTRQFVDGEDHRGNLLHSSGIIPYFSKSGCQWVFSSSLGYLERVRREFGCYGFGTLDFIIDDRGRMFTLELNCRMTASYFLWELKEQLIKKWGCGQEFSLCLYHCGTPHLKSWGDITGVIGSDLLNLGDSKWGIIPIMPIVGVKTGIISIQPTLEEAEKHCFKIRDKLESH